MNQSKKIVLLGHINVGKTSLIRRFVHHKFSEDYISSIGVNIEKKVVTIGSKQVTFIIWDIEGQSTIENIQSSYLIGLQGVVYVFDLQRKSTWENLLFQLHYLQEHFPFVPVKIVGNKVDLAEESMIRQAKTELKGLNIFLCSAKTGENVDNVFFNLAESFLI